MEHLELGVFGRTRWNGRERKTFQMANKSGSVSGYLSHMVITRSELWSAVRHLPAQAYGWADRRGSAVIEATRCDFFRRQIGFDARRHTSRGFGLLMPSVVNFSTVIAADLPGLISADRLDHRGCQRCSLACGSMSHEARRRRRRWRRLRRDDSGVAVITVEVDEVMPDFGLTSAGLLAVSTPTHGDDLTA